MPVASYKMGPGTLTLGDVGTNIDISCQITSATLSPDKNKDDDLNTLCGGVLAGEITYDWTLKATIIQDLSTNGINTWSLTHAGEQVPFKFVPNTVLDKGFQGTLTVDPLAIGGDVKTRPTADVEWSVVGQPVAYDPTPP
ncbi:hypothetical protein OHB26_03665 [Nocardia sp. NBC_01503]|uniref:hypothetical protein n=1 Tax=Nocardia sp. NBC_01503 TaxID=2975997 RepID=UPI002E7C3F9E|nr:hypothetical protein [Nocardia sp. NBC_01503]WTL33354.1 hypothetical protein OHB26_03665 [Nocardia sp. NBC_01503]